MAISTTGTVSEVLPTYYKKVFLKRAVAKFVYKQLGQMAKHPQGEGKDVYWTRYTNLAATTSALTEGSDPTALGLSATNVTGTVAEYGQMVDVSRLLQLTAIDKQTQSTVEMLADSAADSIDQLVRNKAVTDIAATGGSTLFASGVANRTSLIVTDIFQVADLRKAVKRLKKMNTPKFDSGGYVGVMHPDVEYDIQGDSNWVDAHKYVDNGIDKIYAGEVGKLYGVRFLVSTQAPILTNSGSAGTEVYQTLIVGKEAFGISELEGLKVTINSPSKTSELGRKSTVGWTSSFATEMLNGSFGVVVESAATQ